MSGSKIVVIGGSHAAAQLIASLGSAGWGGEITLISADQRLPYHRPPLSKTYLAGSSNVDQLLIRGQSFYEKLNVQVRLGTRATQISTAAKTVDLDDGTSLSYDKLVLTTGATVRKIDTPGADKGGVFYLRDLADADRIQTHLPQTRQAVVIGGGYIGLEAAASLRKLGLEVTLLEAGPRLLQRVTTERISDFYARVHQEEGVRIMTGTTVASIDGDHRVRSVTLTSGTVLEAQMVIVGIGVAPETDLAIKAGLRVENGVCVDEFGQTSDPDIFAAGDCTSHFSSIYGRHLRLESVQNATDQAKAVADSLLNQRKPYRALPWFWSDQYDVKLQILGLSQGYDRVVIRGETHIGRSFSAFYFLGDRLLAVDAVNRPKDFMFCRKALTEGLTAIPDLLADENTQIQEAFTTVKLTK